MRKFCKLLLFIILVGCIYFSVHSFITNANTGTDCTMGRIITEQTEHFILDTFGFADSPEALANLILDFILEHFTYDESSVTIPQTADTNRFIFKNDFHGVCMDFSAFVKSVFQVICRHKGWEQGGCHVVLGYGLRSRVGHAVNYLSVKNPDGTVTIYEFDTTRDLTLRQKGQAVQGIQYSIVADSPDAVPQVIREAFSEFYKYPILIIT